MAPRRAVVVDEKGGGQWILLKYAIRVTAFSCNNQNLYWQVEIEK